MTRRVCVRDVRDVYGVRTHVWKGAAGCALSKSSVTECPGKKLPKLCVGGNFLTNGSYWEVSYGAETAC